MFVCSLKIYKQISETYKPQPPFVYTYPVVYLRAYKRAIDIHKHQSP